MLFSQLIFGLLSFFFFYCKFKTFFLFFFNLARFWRTERNQSRLGDFEHIAHDKKKKKTFNPSIWRFPGRALWRLQILTNIFGFDLISVYGFKRQLTTEGFRRCFSRGSWILFYVLFICRMIF